MKIYVSAKWEDRERAFAVMEELKRRGHIITYDWTHVGQASTAQAEKDLHGAIQADCLIFLADKPFAFKGAYVEIGAALAMGNSVIWVGHEADSNIFRFCKDVIQVDTLEDAYGALDN